MKALQLTALAAISRMQFLECSYCYNIKPISYWPIRTDRYIRRHYNSNNYSRPIFGYLRLRVGGLLFYSQPINQLDRQPANQRASQYRQKFQFYVSRPTNGSLQIMRETDSQVNRQTNRRADRLTEVVILF